jgi:hypothetical protein
MDDASILDLPAPSSDHRLRYGSGPKPFRRVPPPTRRRSLPCRGNCAWRFLAVHQGLGYFGHLDTALRERGIATWNIEYNRVGHPAGGGLGPSTMLAPPWITFETLPRPIALICHAPRQSATRRAVTSPCGCRCGIACQQSLRCSCATHCHCLALSRSPGCQTWIGAGSRTSVRTMFCDACAMPSIKPMMLPLAPRPTRKPGRIG